MRARHAWLAFAVLGTAGCGSDTTELVVVVDTDIGDVDAIVVDVTGPSGEEQRARAELTGEGAVERPVVVGLVPAGSELEPVTVRAAGLVAGEEIVTRRAVTGFVKGEVRMLRLLLRRACAGVSCGDGETCAAGECASDVVPREELPPWEGEPEPLPPCEPEGDELCNGIDDDCDGFVDEGHDVDGDDFTWCGGGDPDRQDCDDADPDVHPAGPDGEPPAAPERCNGRDDDCDETVDEDPPDGPICPAGRTCVSGRGCVEPDCTSTGCDDEQYCDVSASPPMCREGTPCESTDDCDPGTVCDTATGSCVEQKGLGEACTVDAECDSGVCVLAEALRLDTGRSGGVCVQSCCNASDCPADTICWVSGSGSRVCIPGTVAGVTGGDGGAEADCMDPTDCASAVCDEAGIGCIAYCAGDETCADGRACARYRFSRAGGDASVLACRSGREGMPIGDECSASDDCRSGMCLGPSFNGECTGGCRTTDDCGAVGGRFVGAGYCGFLMAEDTGEWLQVCARNTGGDSARTGDSCTEDGDCRDRGCIDGTCADTCCNDAHCTGGIACRPVRRDEGRWEMRCVE